jgi:predicted enzyme related to lactoylglutathione lyase
MTHMSDWARPVVHFEIEARDAQSLRTFYMELFNWDISEGPYIEIKAGIGGPEPGPGGHIRQSDRSGVTLNIQVRDIDETLEKAKALGGAVVLERLQIPDGATLAAITDPEGNSVTLVQQ